MLVVVDFKIFFFFHSIPLPDVFPRPRGPYGVPRDSEDAGTVPIIPSGPCYRASEPGGLPIQCWPTVPPFPGVSAFHPVVVVTEDGQYSKVSRRASPQYRARIPIIVHTRWKDAEEVPTLQNSSHALPNSIPRVSPHSTRYGPRKHENSAKKQAKKLVVHDDDG